MDSMSPGRKRLTTVLIVLLIVFLNPLTIVYFALYNTELNKRSRIYLYDFPGTVWVCDDPEIHLEIPEKQGDRISGYIKKNGESIDFFLSTTAGPDATLIDTRKYDAQIYDERELCEVTYIIDMDSKKIIWKIHEDNVWGKKYRKITLYLAEGEIRDRETIIKNRAG